MLLALRNLYVFMDIALFQFWFRIATIVLLLYG